MSTGSAPIKTPEGQAELATRQRRVSQRHRTMLFLVDGRRSEAQIKQLATQAGVPESCYGELIELGLIGMPALVTVPATLPGELAGPTSAIDLAPDKPSSDGDETPLPPSRTLQPESSLNGALSAAESWLPPEANGELPSTEMPLDAPLEEARDILLRAVRAEAPVAGSLTLLRLRRARTRDDLRGLLDEVGARIRKPHRLLSTEQTLRRVRELLGTP